MGAVRDSGGGKRAERPLMARRSSADSLARGREGGEDSTWLYSACDDEAALEERVWPEDEDSVSSESL